MLKTSDEVGENIYKLYYKGLIFLIFQVFLKMQKGWKTLIENVKNTWRDIMKKRCKNGPQIYEEIFKIALNWINVNKTTVNSIPRVSN